MNTSVMLMAAGGGLNLIDALTAKGADGGAVFGSTGFLKGINDKLPINLGLMLFGAGLGLFLWNRYKN